MRKLLSCTTVLLLASSLTFAQANRAGAHRAGSQAKADQGGPAAVMNAVDAKRIGTHIEFLSGDLLEGRGTGQRGGDIAAHYLAAQLELYGVQPAGDNGSYFQKVAMVGITTEPGSSMTIVPQSGQPMPLQYLQDFVATNETQEQNVQVDAPLVFVGYGIVAPEYNWNDYAGAGITGKVAMVIVNEPPSKQNDFFTGDALTYYGRWTYKLEEAARQGAAGVLIVHRTDLASYPWDVVRNSWSGEKSFLASDRAPKLKFGGWVQHSVGNQLAQLLGTNIDDLISKAGQRGFKPMPVPATVRATINSRVRKFDSQNVVGKITGGDPKLKDEAIFYTAHYDHLGMRQSASGDNIYNGAVDNATGCAIVLEIAHGFQHAPKKPGRSVYFAFVTAEEQGLWGSYYLGQNPPVPAGQIALDLNFDGLNPIGVPTEVRVAGAERTTFWPVVQQVARQFQFGIGPEMNPGAGYYYRSDHFSFARVGVPAFSVNQGSKYEGKPDTFASEQEDDYRTKRYHAPEDEFDPKWDFSGLAKMARFGIALGWRAATMNEQIGWNKGDEFEPARIKSLQRGAPH